MSWQKKYTKALQGGRIEEAIEILDGSAATDHAGTPPLATKREAFALLIDTVPQGELGGHIGTLLGSSSATAREFASALLGIVSKSDPKSIYPLMLRVADDPNWEVRETAAGLFATILLESFDRTYDHFLELTRHPSANVRRAVAVAAKYVAKERKPEYGAPLLDLLEPLLSDRTEYVRKNLGPFAIGDGLLRCYPGLTMERLTAWSASDDEMIRWNVAMALSTAESRKHLDAALPILDALAADERRMVWRAVAAAVKNHARRLPEQVLPFLRRWKSDPKRRGVAEVVDNYL